MRFRHVMAALMPVGAASALAILPIGTPVAAQAATPAAGHVTPEASSPLAYRYVGKDGSRAPSSGYLFTCQEPGASPNCYTPQELATAYDIPKKLTGAGQTIVLIDAFGDPTITQDLGVEDSTFKLPGGEPEHPLPQWQARLQPGQRERGELVGRDRA